MTDAGRSTTPPDVLTSFDAWLTAWFREHLNYDEIESRTDGEFAAVLLSDLHSAGFTVASAAASRQQPSTPA